MSAQELKDAAATLRKVAKAATPGPWERPLNVRYKDVVTAALPEDETGRYLSGNTPDGHRERVGVVSVNTWSDGSHLRKRGGRDLEWIALVHPGLAEPLADLLDAVAAKWPAASTESAELATLVRRCALATARTIKGTTS